MARMTPRPSRRRSIRTVALVAMLLLAAQAPTAGEVRAADPPVRPGRLMSETSGTSVAASAAVAPSGFTDSTLFSGLTFPMAVRFSPDGRVFVAEKSGIIRVFASLNATTSTVFADLRPQVDNYWDRGLLGFTLDPDFPTTPYVYVSYAFDALIGGTAPLWNDACPSSPAGPGPTSDGCTISGRLSRLTVSGNTVTT
jgi:glucose/arabinose dehydrogenase